MRVGKCQRGPPRRTGSREIDSYMTETATMTPEPQRLRALERANEVRLARAELKRRTAEGDVAAGEVICPPVGPTRTEVDFVAIFARPSKATQVSLGGILSPINLNTQCSESLVRYVCGSPRGIGQ